MGKALEALETRHEKRVRHHEQQKIQTTKVSMSEERVKAIQALETKKKIIEDGSIVVPTFIDERAIEERMKAIETVEKRSASAANYSVAASGMADERLDAIDALEAKRRKVEAEQLRYKDFDDGSDSSRLSAIQLLELRREQANRKVERNTKERETPSAITALEIQLQH